MSGEDEELSPQEAQALRALAEGPEPPGDLEEAAVARLRADGGIGIRNPNRRSWLAAAAAALVSFAAGLWLGGRRLAVPAEASRMPRFVLLLYDAPDEETLTEHQMEGRVEEYRSWAQRVRAGGREIAGEKLEPEGKLLGPQGGAAGWPLGGYFIISAKDLDAAVELARSCPHLKYGGRVEVRAIADFRPRASAARTAAESFQTGARLDPGRLRMAAPNGIDEPS